MPFVTKFSLYLKLHCQKWTASSFQSLNLEQILFFTIYRLTYIGKIQHLKMYANFNDYAISVSVMFTIFSSSSQTILSFREVLKSLMIRERNFGNGNRYNQATFWKFMYAYSVIWCQEHERIEFNIYINIYTYIRFVSSTKTALHVIKMRSWFDVELSSHTL